MAVLIRYPVTAKYRPEVRRKCSACEGEFPRYYLRLTSAGKWKCIECTAAEGARSNGDASISHRNLRGHRQHPGQPVPATLRLSALEIEYGRAFYEQGLNTLPAAQQEIVYWRLEGMEVTEIGRRLGIKQPAASTRLKRATEALLLAMGLDEYGELLPPEHDPPRPLEAARIAIQWKAAERWHNRQRQRHRGGDVVLSCAEAWPPIPLEI